MKTMKFEAKSFLIFRIVAVIFYGLILLTMFMPMLSIDKYVEYEFFDAQYYGEYQSSATPLATKITPLDLMKNVKVEDKTVSKYKREYTKVNNQLKQRYENGEITLSEYEQLLSEDPTTCIYYVSAIYNGTPDFTRMQDKISLISYIMIVIYSFAGLMLIFNLFNIIFNTKFLYITNAQASWIYAAATLIFVIYIFSTSFTNFNSYEDNAGVLESTMVCLSANSTFITLIIAEIAFSVVSIIISSKFNKFFTYVEEVPEFISYRIKKESKKPYLAPESQPKKPKSYYTKKHKKHKKKKNGKKR